MKGRPLATCNEKTCAEFAGKPVHWYEIVVDPFVPVDIAKADCEWTVPYDGAALVSPPAAKHSVNVPSDGTTPLTPNDVSVDPLEAVLRTESTVEHDDFDDR